MHTSSTLARRPLIWFRRAAGSVAVAALAATVSGCGDTVRSLGPSPAAAESNADQLFEAFRARFNAVEFSPSYDAARKKIAQSALVPSGIFDDELWGARPSAALRILYVSGNTLDGHYRLDTRPSPSEAMHPGDSRHVISLARLESSVFRWDTQVDMAIGQVSAGDVSALVTSLLAAPAGHTEQALRADYRAGFPRAVAAFGRGLAIDSLRIVPGADGVTSVTMTIAFHPELMRPGFPALADYVDKYLGPARYHLAFADRAGVALFDIVGRDRAATLRYRVQSGKLTSLFGPPRAWPDTVLLTSDMSVKVKLFTVGFHNLLTDLVITDVGHDRGWAVVARQEPKWDLPFIAERLIRSPLRRPFQDGGALFRLSVRDSAGAQSLFVRRTRLDVQESTIMRFLGGLASHAVGDVNASVEADEGRFFRDGFTALQADLRAAPHRGAF